MMAFDWAEPATLKEAVALLDPEDATVRAVAGGTALMLMMKAGVFQPTRLISLAKIEPHYSQVRIEKDGTLKIGAMATLSAVEQSADVAEHFPVITETLRTLSNVRVRNVARVGGALAHGDPHMDLPPLFAALGARVVARGTAEVREIEVAELYAGYYETHLKRDELIAEVIVPGLKDSRAAYLKCTSRSADDWPALGLAVHLDVEGRDVIKRARIVLGAATDKVTRLKETEDALNGATPTDPVLKRAAATAAEEVSLLGDAHGSAAYKRELLKVYLVRAIRHALRGKHA
ncbi:MAG TPA: FAD binding domain-containing protein [Micropepsaceae bacterium]|nr:FAD binding domain-containing protein [Micropepsaceae bacterium]